ncbi:hypothetical protein AHAS_Ahas13G0285300 [Arachis hypogaea]
MVGLVGNYKGSTIAIGLICILEWLLLIVRWWKLLPKRLIICSRLLPPLMVPFLIHIFIVAFIPYNIYSCNHSHSQRDENS